MMFNHTSLKYWKSYLMTKDLSRILSFSLVLFSCTFLFSSLVLSWANLSFFRQGLFLSEDLIFESTGLYGKSVLKKMKKDGEIIQQIEMNSQYFGILLSF